MNHWQYNGLVFEQGGKGGALLVLIHGLGATARVWAPMLEQAPHRWPGRWIAPDLRGHGASARRRRYGIDDYAADVMKLIRLERPESVTLLGHSLGGVIALALAGESGIRPARAFGLGIKVDWTDDQVEKMSALSLKPPRLFANAEDARAQHRRQCGLECELASSLLERGVIQEGAEWRTALDQAVYVIEPPRMDELLRSAACPVSLACGEADPVVSAQRLRDFDGAAVSIAGAGHNAMVDGPVAVWDWMDRASS